MFIRLTPATIAAALLVAPPAAFAGSGAQSDASKVINNPPPPVEFACADPTNPWSLIGKDDLSGEACSQPPQPRMLVAETLTADGQGIIDEDGNRIVSF